MTSLYQRFLAHYGTSDVFVQLRGLLQSNQLSDTTELEAACRRVPLVLDGCDGSADGLAWFHSSPEQREQAAGLVSGILGALEGDWAAAAGATPPILWSFGFIQRVMEEQPPLQATARRLLFEADDALSIKVALLIFGALQGESREDELDAAMVLGRHPEFAWYASRYLYQKLANPEAQLWELAMAEDGWGRIMSLKVLMLLYERRPVPPPICRWLWRSGYHNTVSPAYTAIDILIRGGLKEMLMVGKLDEATLRGVETVLAAALPQVDCDRWPDAPSIFRHYRRHAGDRYRTDFLPPGI